MTANTPSIADQLDELRQELADAPALDWGRVGLRLATMATHLRSHTARLPGDERATLYAALLRDQGDAVYEQERHAIANYIEAQGVYIKRLETERSEAVEVFAGADAERIGQLRILEAENTALSLRITEMTAERDEAATIGRKLALIVREFHEKIVYGDSYGVPGSDFWVCMLCGAGGAPGAAFVHKPDCTALKAEESALEDFESYVELIDENDALRKALRFAASCIKSGEPWTTKCEEVIGSALTRLDTEGE